MCLNLNEGAAREPDAVRQRNISFRVLCWTSFGRPHETAPFSCSALLDLGLCRGGDRGTIGCDRQGWRRRRRGRQQREWGRRRRGGRGEETIAAEVVAMTIPVGGGGDDNTGRGGGDNTAAAVAETTEAVEADRVMTMAGAGADVHPEAAAGAAPRRSRRGMPSRKGGRCL